jgi:hypothetical protein
MRIQHLVTSARLLYMGRIGERNCAEPVHMRSLLFQRSFKIMSSSSEETSNTDYFQVY